MSGHTTIGAIRRRRGGEVLLLAGILAAALVSCGESSPEVAVSIVSPQDGAQVDAGEPVKLDVELQGGEIAGHEGHEEAGDEGGGENVGHLHVFVNGQLASMPETLTPEIELEPGTHTVMVEFVDEEHRQLDPRITDEITVEAS